MSYEVIHSVIDQYVSGHCKINIEGNSVEVRVDYDFQSEMPEKLEEYERYDTHDHYGGCDEMCFYKTFENRTEALKQVSVINEQFEEISNK